MNVGSPNATLSRLARVSEMSIVAFDSRKGKSVGSEGTLIKIIFSKVAKDKIDGQPL